MAERIREAAVAMRREIEWGRWQGGVNRAVAQFAVAQLYSTHAEIRRRTVELSRQKLVKAVTKEYFPDAMDAGRRGAEPILRGLEGSTHRLRTSDDVRRALRLKGNAAKWHRREIKAIRQQFAADLNAASSSLSPQAEAVLMRARRDAASQGKGVRGLADTLARADRSALNAGLKRRQNVRRATETLRDAERAGDEPGTKAARKELTKAKSNAARSREYTFLERFETMAQGAARNAIRRVAQQSQMAYFKNAGYTGKAMYTYVAANGTDACPSCAERHGVTQTQAQWSGEGPSEDTYCGDSCCCQLVPAGYAASNQTLSKPLSLDKPPHVGPPAPVGTEPDIIRRPPKGGFGHLASKAKSASKRKAPAAKQKPKPVKLGGENARLAKEVKKRAAKLAPVKTISEAETWVRSRMTTGAKGGGVDLARFAKGDASVMRRYLGAVEQHRAGIPLHRVKTRVGDIGELSGVSRLHMDRGVPARMQTKSLSIYGPVYDLKSGRFEKWLVENGLDKQMAIRTVEDVAVHEMGHLRTSHFLHLTRQRVPKFTAANKALAGKISPYARANYREYLAEAYTASNNGVAPVDAGTRKLLGTMKSFLGSPERTRLEAAAAAYAKSPSAALAKKWDELAARAAKKYKMKFPSPGK